MSRYSGSFKGSPFKVGDLAGYKVKQFFFFFAALRSDFLAKNEICYVQRPLKISTKL